MISNRDTALQDSQKSDVTATQKPIAEVWPGKKLCDLNIIAAFTDAHRVLGLPLERKVLDGIKSSKLESSYDFSVSYPETIPSFDGNFLLSAFSCAALGFARNRFRRERADSDLYLQEIDFQHIACDSGIDRAIRFFKPVHSTNSSMFLAYLSRCVNSEISNHLSRVRKLLNLEEDSAAYGRSDIYGSSLRDQDFSSQLLHFRVVREGRENLISNLSRAFKEVAERGQHFAVGLEMLLLSIGLDADFQPREKVKYNELALLFDCAENTVGSKINRIKFALREALTARCSKEDWIYLSSLPELEVLAA